MARNTEELTARDIDLLECLASYKEDEYHKAHGIMWCRPLDVGGTNGSYHSTVLLKLVKRKLVLKSPRTSWSGGRGSFRYTISVNGEAILKDRGYYDRLAKQRAHANKVSKD